MAYISDKKDLIDTPQAAEAVAAVRQGFTLSLEQIGHLPAGEKDKLFDKCCFAYDVQTKRLVPQLQIALVSRLCAFLRTLTTTLHLFQLHLPASRPRRGAACRCSLVHQLNSFHFISFYSSRQRGPA